MGKNKSNNRNEPLVCPECGEMDEIYYMGENMAICETCKFRFSLERASTKKQRKEKKKRE